MQTTATTTNDLVRIAWVAYTDALIAKASKWPEPTHHHEFLSRCEAKLDAIQAQVDRLEKFRF